MKKTNVKKLATAAMLVALTVALSGFSIPVGASKCFPIQHLANVLAGVFLGPVYGVTAAFCSSLLRNLMGTGSLLAFPGSMIGALCCGLLFSRTKKLSLAYLGEVIGTGVLGGMLCYPVATYLMGREAALFAYVIPFLISTCGGTLMAMILIAALQKTGAMAYLRRLLEGEAVKN